jgi:hypothetical protein
MEKFKLTQERRYSMKGPEKRPVIKLVGVDGNAFGIMGKVKRVLRSAGADQEYINKYLQESMSGDYNHLLSTAMNYVEVR